MPCFRSLHHSRGLYITSEIRRREIAGQRSRQQHQRRCQHDRHREDDGEAGADVIQREVFFLYEIGASAQRADGFSHGKHRPPSTEMPYSSGASSRAMTAAAARLTVMTRYRPTEAQRTARLISVINPWRSRM